MIYAPARGSAFRACICFVLFLAFRSSGTAQQQGPPVVPPGNPGAKQQSGSTAPASPAAPGQTAPGQAPPGQTLPASGGNSNGVPPPDTASNPNALPMEFQSHGMDYETLTRNGITVMFAALPPHVKDFNIVQVTVTNGSLLSWTVKPADFTFVRPDGTTLTTVSADDVVESLLEKAGRNDVIKLQLLYEATIYSLSNFRSTNGYEQRREAAMAQFVNPRFKAAAAASAITLVSIKLRPGDSTDGAVFFENRTKEKSLGPGRLLAHTCGETFIFQIYPEPKLH